MAAAHALAEAAPTCAPARAAGVDPQTLPPAWRAALDGLLAATGRPGQPWSCTGAQVTLVVDADGGEITVTEIDGRVAHRRVATPEDVSPEGEALLTRGAAPPARVEAPPAARAPAVPREVPPPPRKPVHFDVVLGPRLTGPTTTLWMSVGARGVLPFGMFAFAFWGRFEGPIDRIDAQPPAQMSEGSLGIGFGPHGSIGRFSFDVALDPSLAIVAMEAPDEASQPHSEGARAALRLGVSSRATYQLTRILRGVVALDGEIAPVNLGSPDYLAPRLPPIPGFTVGLGLGIEIDLP